MTGTEISLIGGFLISMTGIFVKLSNLKTNHDVEAEKRLGALYKRMDEKTLALKKEMKEDYVQEIICELQHKVLTKNFDEFKTDNKNEHERIFAAIKDLGIDIKTQVSNIYERIHNG